VVRGTVKKAFIVEGVDVRVRHDECGECGKECNVRTRRKVAFWIVCVSRSPMEKAI
jgi:hypothetical protein